MKRIINFLFGTNNECEEIDFIEKALFELDTFKTCNELKVEINKELALIDMMVDNLFEQDSDFSLIKF